MKHLPETALSRAVATLVEAGLALSNASLPLLENGALFQPRELQELRRERGNVANIAHLVQGNFRPQDVPLCQTVFSGLSNIAHNLAHRLPQEAKETLMGHVRATDAANRQVNAVIGHLKAPTPREEINRLAHAMGLVEQACRLLATEACNMSIDRHDLPDELRRDLFTQSQVFFYAWDQGGRSRTDLQDITWLRGFGDRLAGIIDGISRRQHLPGVNAALRRVVERYETAGAALTEALTALAAPSPAPEGPSL